jgi:hypothetical protein
MAMSVSASSAGGPALELLAKDGKFTSCTLT